MALESQRCESLSGNTSAAYDDSIRDPLNHGFQIEDYLTGLTDVLPINDLETGASVDSSWSTRTDEFDLLLDLPTKDQTINSIETENHDRCTTSPENDRSRRRPSAIGLAHLQLQLEDVIRRIESSDFGSTCNVFEEVLVASEDWISITRSTTRSPLDPVLRMHTTDFTRHSENDSATTFFAFGCYFQLMQCYEALVISLRTEVQHATSSLGDAVNPSTSPSSNQTSSARSSSSSYLPEIRIGRFNFNGPLTNSVSMLLLVVMEIFERLQTAVQCLKPDPTPVRRSSLFAADTLGSSLDWDIFDPSEGGPAFREHSYTPANSFTLSFWANVEDRARRLLRSIVETRQLIRAHPDLNMTTFAY